MKPHKKLSNNNSAVSPLIGEILMVAIVVILGAIIASYAFGTTKGPLQQNYLVGTSADKINEDNILVSLMGGKDADKLLYLNVSVNGNYSGGSNIWPTTQANTFNGNGIDAIKVGTTVLLTDDGTGRINNNRDHVIIVGQFMDGTSSIVLDTYI